MKELLMIICLVATSSIVFAQGPNRERPSMEEQIEKATKELNLTDEQVEQWTAIHKKYESSMKEREEGRETRKKMGAELEAILNDDQLAKFKEMQKKRPERRRN